MAAPVAARGALFTLAAFNLELARIPWVTRETVLAQMRLQFWRDVVAGEDPAPHEVAGPLRALLAGTDLTPAPLLAMIDAREVCRNRMTTSTTSRIASNRVVSTDLIESRTNRVVS